MSEEQGFLHAIQARPHDDVPRLIYADWLDERDDPRGEYLRLQCELVRTWTYLNPQTKLRQRIGKLWSKLDPNWLLQVRRYTTPPAPVDVGAAIPALKRKARTAVLLHPRRGEAPADASKIGGLFLWPEDEEWPTCPEHTCPLVTALQLRKEDIPEVGFRRGTDLFQVLWCPHWHDYDEGYVAPQLFWRKRSNVTNQATSHPPSAGADEDYVPEPCVLTPERVIEYPSEEELSTRLTEKTFEDAAPLQEAVRRLQGMPVPRHEMPHSPSSMYADWLSTSCGTKIGGYPKWMQFPHYPPCSCGRAMKHLISFSSWKYRNGDRRRWLPVEDREVLDAHLDPFQSENWDPKHPAIAPAKWMFGDAGFLHLFICRKCPNWPIFSYMDNQ
jgi:uncharacterized protein (TIGR02996 family)